MVPVPPRDGKPGFWIGACEVTWELFDLFIFGIDGDREREGDGIDAYTRPSKPYVPPDRGYGHEGYPVISASYRNAFEFCRWLTAKTGHEYRLPTVEEWRHAAAAGSAGRWSTGDDPAALGEIAWYDGNADGTTHPVGKKGANAWGLHDAHGNAGEWCVEVGADGERRTVLCGGSFRGTADEVATAAVERPHASWQMSDPQLPKSRWWLADAPFAGLRVLRPFPTAETEKESGASPAPKEDR
jgi:formylglycine-generating enzyme required for sulfatase activity